MKIEIELDELTKEEQETVKRLAEKAKRLYFVPNKQERYFFCHSGGEVLATFNDSIHDDFAEIGEENVKKYILGVTE